MESEASVPSPCVDVCKLDDTLGYCIGCYRTLTEIAEWSEYSNTRKLEVLAQARMRRATAQVRN